ncbi:unnamed protein product, partial [Phaeothamnion confervicola]
SAQFWVRLQSRYGTQFYVRDNGEDQAVMNAVDTIDYCLRSVQSAVHPAVPPSHASLSLPFPPQYL